MMDHKRIPVEELPVMKSVYIGALASNGQISAALKLYEELKEDKCDVDPKVIKYLIVSNTCLAEGVIFVFLLPFLYQLDIEYFEYPAGAFSL